MRRKIKDVCSVFCLLIIVGTYSGFYINPQFIIGNFSLLGDKIALINSLLSPRTSGMKIEALKEFTSVEEIIIFLKEDNTNEFIWSQDFTCAQFSEMLIRRAKEKGYYLRYLGLYGIDLKHYQDDYVLYMESLGYISWWGPGEGHAICVTFLEGRKIVIEPQTDVILEEVNGRYVGLYRGEN